MQEFNRRGFLGALGKGAVGLALAGAGRCSPPHHPLSAWVRANDQSLAYLMDRIGEVRGGPFRGAVPNRDGLFVPMSTALFLQYATSAYVSTASRYFEAPRVEACMAEAAQALRRMQHRDGSIDLPTTNFHSPPDTAFVVEPLALSLHLLQRHGAPEKVRQPIEAFLEQAEKPLLEGGIHTPNHRWVVCMALAHLYRLSPRPDHLRRIDQWLAEGIDIDRDGQYDERSVAIYSPLTDRCLITLARLLGRPELLDPVRRNLESTLYFFHPDGSLATEGSRRQDQFQRQYAQAYYYPYAFMGAREGNPRFAAAADRIAQTAGVDRLKRYLIHFQEERDLLPNLPRPGKMPQHYVRHFAEADMLRIRRGAIDATFVAHNPVFLSMRRGSCTLQAVRLASAFFGKGQFEGEALQVDGQRFRQTQALEGPYYQPLDSVQYELLKSRPWEESRKARPQSEVQQQEASVELRETATGFELDIAVRGTDGVPVALELAFGDKGYLSGVRKLAGGRGFLLPDGQYGAFHAGSDIIRFGPGQVAHQWTRLRGALPPLEGNTVYLTGYSPLRMKLQLM